MVLVLLMSLSTAVIDNFQSAIVSTCSNDLFRNKLSLWRTKAAVILIMIPVALKSPDVLKLYLISEFFGAESFPVVVIGLGDGCYWLRAFEVVVGSLGGLLTVFVFGTMYYRYAQEGVQSLLLGSGLDSQNRSAFRGCPPLSNG